MFLFREIALTLLILKFNSLITELMRVVLGVVTEVECVRIFIIFAMVVLFETIKSLKPINSAIAIKHA